MICLILAAGYATRLYPLTENFPKPLLKVGEKTILDHLTDDIQKGGKVSEFVVISNHKFAQHFEDWVGIYFVIILYSKLNRGTLGTEHEKFVSIWKLVGFITKLHQCTIIINKSTSRLRMKKR